MRYKRIRGCYKNHAGEGSIYIEENKRTGVVIIKTRKRIMYYYM